MDPIGLTDRTHPCDLIQYIQHQSPGPGLTFDLFQDQPLIPIGYGHNPIARMRIRQKVTDQTSGRTTCTDHQDILHNYEDNAVQRYHFTHVETKYF